MLLRSFASCITLLIVLGGTLAPAAVTIDGIAASVNGEVITLLELEKAGLPILEKRLPSVLKRERGRVRREVLLTVLDGLILRTLQVQKARQIGLRVSEAEIDNAISTIRESNNLTESMFVRALLEKGITLEAYRSQLYDQILFSKLMQKEIRTRVAITPDEIENYYQTNVDEYFQPARIKVRHLLVPIEEGASDETVQEARQRALDILEEYRNGSEFAELVKEHSPASGANDGEASDWLKRGEFLQELEDVAFALPAGHVSEPIRSRSGFHLIQLVDKQEATQLTLEIVTESIEEKLTRLKMEEDYADWLKELREESQVQILY